MKLPVAIRLTRDKFISKFPFPSSRGEPIEEFENTFRTWFGKLIQQIVFSHPNQGIGWKSADSSRPPSKDFMAARINEHGESELIGWDMFLGVGTGKPQLNDNPDSASIPGQNFIPITGKDYLSETPENPTGPVITVPPVTSGQAEILEEFDETQISLKEILAEIKSQNLKLVQGLSDVKDAIEKGIKIRF